jgi:HEAT repeat protein
VNGLRRLVPAFLAALVLAAARPAYADVVSELLERYRAVDGRHDDPAYQLQRETLEQIADVGTPAAKKALRSLLDDERRGDRRRLILILTAIVRRGGPDEIDLAIKEAEVARDAAVLGALPRILAAAQAPDARDYVRGPALARASPAVKPQVVRALGATGDKASTPALLATLRDDDLLLRSEALLALAEIGDDSAFPAMVLFLKAPDARVRDVCARALGMLGSSRAVPHLVASLEDPAPRVVESAAHALGLLSADVAVTALIDRLEKAEGGPPAKAGTPKPPAKEPEDLRLVDGLQRALQRITGMTLGDDPDLWRAWWRENHDRTRGETKHPDAPTTVSGPRYYGFTVRSSRVAFVLDVSRSMGWNGRLDSAQKELAQAIEHLPSRTRFTLITYSDVAKAWEDKLVPASAENTRRALRYVQRLEPIAGTNIWDGLRLAFRDDDVDTIFFLSDGTPTVGPVVDQDAILAEVREMNRWRRVRIHTVALLKGEAPVAMAEENPAAAAAFMRRLAEENDGEFREVR